MGSLRLSLRPRNPSWIWIRYIQYATTGTTLCHPQNCLCRCDALFRSRHLALNSPLGHFNGDNARLFPNPPVTQISWWLQSSFPPTANMAFAKLRRNTIPRTSHDTRCFLNSIISPFRLLLTTFPTRLAAQTQTTYSMLQIKTILKTFRLRHLEPSPSYHHHHHHHHLVLAARISLTLSRHSSLSFIALGRSSGQLSVSSHCCWMYVRAGRPAFARPCVGIHKSTSLMSSSLLLQQCPACLVRLTWIVFVIGGRWPSSWCLVGCYCQDLFRIARSILV